MARNCIWHRRSTHKNENKKRHRSAARTSKHFPIMCVFILFMSIYTKLPSVMDCGNHRRLSVTKSLHNYIWCYVCSWVSTHPPTSGPEPFVYVTCFIKQMLKCCASDAINSFNGLHYDLYLSFFFLIYVNYWRRKSIRDLNISLRAQAASYQ